MLSVRSVSKALAIELAAQAPLFDKDGLSIAMSPECWRLNSVVGENVIDWRSFGYVEGDVARAVIAFVRYNVERNSVGHCCNVFRYLATMTMVAERLGTKNLRESLFAYLSELRGSGLEWQFHHVRYWYRWCSRQDLPAFDDRDLCYDLTELRIPGNTKGEAVLSEDPDGGPLDELEEIALRAALMNDEGPLIERAVAWSFLALGSNPANIAFLCEDDFRTIANGDDEFFSINVPRIKKRQPMRSQFKTRKLDRSLAAIFEELRSRNEGIGIPVGYSRPLFSRSTPRPACIGTPIEAFAYHHNSAEIRGLLKRCVRRLKLRSPRTGEPLSVTPRRLRYTFATRKVQEGCSMEALAELLDHTDLQHVLIYYAGTSMTQRLDDALAVSVGPLVKRFMGRIVSSSANAAGSGGSVKATPMGRIKDVGTCGSSSLCTLYPPFSCYLCPQFQPWRSAPHREVLEDTIRQRDDRIEAVGRSDDRIAKQYDELILAIGEVVALCENS